MTGHPAPWAVALACFTVIILAAYALLGRRKGPR